VDTLVDTVDTSGVWVPFCQERPQKSASEAPVGTPAHHAWHSQCMGWPGELNPVRRGLYKLVPVIHRPCRCGFPNFLRATEPCAARPKIEGRQLGGPADGADQSIGFRSRVSHDEPVARIGQTFVEQGPCAVSEWGAGALDQ
jgi:hypothetical protein